MLYTDIFFLFYFLPIFLLLLRFFTKNGKLNLTSKISIVVATLVFYAYENWHWVLIFIGVVSGAHFFGKLINKTKNLKLRGLFLGGSIFYCIGILSIFKYLNWLSSVFPSLAILKEWFLPWFGKNKSISLPPGISFYVFEVISYCCDIYKRKINPPRSIINFFCFVAMFPRFIAGPIVRYTDLEKQIWDWKGMRVTPGLTLFAVGFSIKAIFADQFAIFVPYAFEVNRPDLCQAWLGVLSYSMQLYFDFWSYSIMATGLGLCLGFEFPDNFRSPYHATSVTQFWRQWHITLSNWLRDYLFIPLGGSQWGKTRTVLNLLITMLIAGLWHGASLTFLAWGIYQGVLLAAERILDNEKKPKRPVIICRAQTLGFIFLGWALFRSDSFEQFYQVIQGMLGINGLNEKFNLVLIEKNLPSVICSVLGILFCILGEGWLVTNKPLAEKSWNNIEMTCVYLVFLLALALNASSSEIPFLYFRF